MSKARRTKSALDRDALIANLNTHRPAEPKLTTETP